MSYCQYLDFLNPRDAEIFFKTPPNHPETQKGGFFLYKTETIFINMHMADYFFSLTKTLTVQFSSLFETHLLVATNNHAKFHNPPPRKLKVKRAKKNRYLPVNTYAQG